MPIYAYRCAACGHAKDVLQKMSDPVLSTCPACGAESFSKQLTAAGFQLKGTGWYATDFKGGGKAPPASDAEGKTGEGKPGDAGADKNASTGDAKSAGARASEAGAAKPAEGAAAKPTGGGSAPPAAGATGTPAKPAGGSAASPGAAAG